MKNTFILLPVLFFVILFAFPSSSHAQVFSDYDGKVDFSKYKTYAWIAPGDSILNSYRGQWNLQNANQLVQRKNAELQDDFNKKNSRMPRSFPIAR